MRVSLCCDKLFPQWSIGGQHVAGRWGNHKKELPFRLRQAARHRATSSHTQPPACMRRACSPVEPTGQATYPLSARRAQIKYSVTAGVHKRPGGQLLFYLGTEGPSLAKEITTTLLFLPPSTIPEKATDLNTISRHTHNSASVHLPVSSPMRS